MLPIISCVNVCRCCVCWQTKREEIVALQCFDGWTDAAASCERVNPGVFRLFPGFFNGLWCSFVQSFLVDCEIVLFCNCWYSVCWHQLCTSAVFSHQHDAKFSHRSLKSSLSLIRLSVAILCASVFIGFFLLKYDSYNPALTQSSESLIFGEFLKEINYKWREQIHLFSLIFSQKLVFFLHIKFERLHKRNRKYVKNM